MWAKLSAVAVAASFALSPSAQAADIAIRITDQDGNPAADAVIVLVAANGALEQQPSPSPQGEALIDQRDETFTPHVTIIPRGGRVRFANSDAPLHQVYSFSPIKQFELSLAPGETSDRVIFDRSGVAAIGCNIHDNMIAYVFVTDSPWTALSDERGRARIERIPSGDYISQIWHPRLPPATLVPNETITIDGATKTYETQIPLLPDRSAHRSHGGRY